MKQLRLVDKKRALIVVAHPDDETIWMGGTILSFPRVNWTIFSLCRADDADREPKFRRVCARYGARSLITDMDDEGNLDSESAVAVVKKLLKGNLKNSFDYVFTHGVNGEYGHPLHTGVHEGVSSLVASRFLEPGIVFYFNYKKIGSGTNVKLTAKADSDVSLPLPRNVMAEKKRIVAEMYGYDYNGIDVGYCTNPEAFKIVTAMHNKK